MYLQAEDLAGFENFLKNNPDDMIVDVIGIWFEGPEGEGSPLPGYHFNVYTDRELDLTGITQKFPSTPWRVLG